MRKLTLAFTCAALLASAQLSAEELNQADIDAYIKYRAEVMSAASAHMGSMAQLVSGKVALPEHMSIHAQALTGLMTDIPALFPKGTDFGETDAKAEIWSDAKKFALASETAQGKAKALNDAVASGDKGAIGAALKDLGSSCKGCHKEYKAKR